MTQIKQYTVEADRATGEWIGEPEYVGTVSRDIWNAKQDTDALHFDTYEAGDPLQSETRAIEIRWVD